MLTRAIRPNLSLPWMPFGKFTRFGVLDVRAEKTMARESCRDFAIRAPSAEFPVVQLSGGNQQKVVLARWFALKPKVVILAEPTRGIDVGAKSEIYGFMQDMAEQGTGIIMISSEMPELLGVADRILVMYQGQLCGEFDPERLRRRGDRPCGVHRRNEERGGGLMADSGGAAKVAETSSFGGKGRSGSCAGCR